jgi:hypothetical protein
MDVSALDRYTIDEISLPSKQVYIEHSRVWWDLNYLYEQQIRYMLNSSRYMFVPCFPYSHIHTYPPCSMQHGLYLVNLSRLEHLKLETLSV